MRNTYNKKHILACIGMLLCFAIMVSCTEWDEYKKYTKDGEIVYIGKFDTAVVFPGKERVRLWGLLTPDPKIVKCKILWGTQDSVIYDINPTESGNVFDQTFNVTEGTKSFTIYTYDADGNSSVAVTSTGNSYGTRYRNTLYNRKIKSMDYDTDTTTIYWDIIDKMLGPVQMEIRYKAVTGDTVVITPATESTSILKGLQYQTEGFTYRTVFKPLPVKENVVCIDTFCTTYSAKGIPTFAEKELDRSLFKAASLTGDVGANGGSGGVAAMWDGKSQNDYGGANFTDIGAGQSSPQMVTVNLGLKAKLSKITIYPFQEWYGFYDFSTMHQFEIWGSSTPSSSGALDGSWTLLTSAVLAKPSGQGSRSETPADVAAAIAGFTFSLDANAPKVKYIRIRCLQNKEGFYNNNNEAFFSAAEIRLYGLLPQ
jgi:hypothetical protein